MYRLICILLIFFSCGPIKKKTISINYSFDSKTTRGIESINRAIGQPAFELVNKNADIRIFEVEEFVSKKKYKKNVVGLAQHFSDRCEIQLKKNKWYPRILTHELGHCLGLRHDYLDKDSFMLRVVKKSSKIRKRHIRRIKRHLKRRK